ncbi:serine/threonine-protein kinase [Actinacidiphila bryophytorum]|uniref:Uncharacterized protein n=1 Tax=Actinacidiphila bryophytorum TaxID=1436133 RepID=A0A9W4H2P6_9ACTN|nr:hypothetical protein [Actinacidiphila bryophytorum]MBM9436988.1 hypothetical protein [Actinacidiphila bryophytorum]MBN6542442.1 hypothetical protein [Actinacidiphila bryophytorum]CAG7646115.1 hypothetical protein SBRY_40330 [Actinacidiphila bryophytorum]
MNESHEYGLQDDDARDESVPGGRGPGHGGQDLPGEPGGWPRPAVAEQLLNGEDVADTDPRTAEVAGLLAAARALPPGRPQDEAAVLDAFRRASAAGSGARRTAVAVPVVRGRRWRTARGPRPVRLLVGGALAVSALGGVAIAAQGGGLPHPFGSSDGSTHGPSAPAPTGGGTGTAPGLPRTPGATTGSASPSALPGTGSPTPGTVSPAPGVPTATGTRGLCEAYTKAEREGTTPEGSVIARLAEAAGSAAGVDAYCAALTGSSPAPGHGHGQRTAQPHPGASSNVPVVPKSATPTGASVRVAPSAPRHK